MKTTFISLASLLIAFSMAGNNKINDEGLQIIQAYKSNHGIKAQSASVTEANMAVNDSYCVLVELDENTTAADLEAKGYNVFSQRANMVLMEIPTSEIEDFAQNDCVQSLSFGIQAVPLNDNARTASYVTEVHAGTGLGADGSDQAYTGKGVITGIFDIGVDPNHPTFYNSDGTESRVKAVYQVSSSGSSYDKKYTTTSAIANFTTDLTTGTHGTHTASIMAGGYRIKVQYPYLRYGNLVTRTAACPYYGMSTESDIIMGCGSSDANSILRAFEYLIAYAKEKSQPLVLNLSFGLNVGPHDGTSTTDKYLAELGKDAIICVAAGNEAESKIAVTKTFTESDTELKTFFSPSTSLVSSYSTRYADFWSTKSTAPSVYVVIYNTTTGEELYSKKWTEGVDLNIGGSSMSSTTYNKPSAFTLNFSARSMIKVSGTKNSTNNRYNVKAYVNIVNSSTNTGDVALGIKIIDEAGTRIDGDVYDSSSDESILSFTNNGIEGWTDGGGDGSISEFACSNNVISVGAYNTRKVWYTLNSGGYSYGDGTGYEIVGAIAPYSSFGTRIDGTKLPHVCAPGTGIISAYNSYYTSNLTEANRLTCQAVTDGTFNGRTYYWATQQGTSMATPHVAGIISLWLQADPTLTVDQVKEIIANTATVDSYVSDATYPTQWGAGKINALAGIKSILKTSGVGNITRDDDQRLLVSYSTDNINVIVAGEGNLIARLYSTTGTQVAAASASSNELNINTSSLTPGIYVLDVTGQNAHYVKKLAIGK